MLRSTLLILLLSSPFWLTAAHLKGGYIEYRYEGPTPGRPGYKRFAITVYQYLDCASSGGQIDGSINLGVFDAVSNREETVSYINLSGTQIIKKRSFDCIDNPPLVCYRIDRYATVLDLEDNSHGYILSVQRCCRIAGINNVANSSNTGVTYTVKLYPSQTDNGLLANNSPIFSQQDTALVCAKNGFTFPFKATDADGDSLVYRFTAGLNTPSREAKPDPPFPPPFEGLLYAGFFRAAQPMGPGVRIDQHTGIISGVAPAAAGDYVVAVLVEEYRRGTKIAETRKEIHITVGNCNNPKANLPASIVNCEDFKLNFENQSYASGINSYYWDFGVAAETTDTSSLPTPVFTYPDTGIYKVKLVVNRGGACPDSTTTDVRIFPGFAVDFSYAGLCRQVPYQFKDESTARYGHINSWTWNFGNIQSVKDTSHLQHPIYTFPTPNSYAVQLIASSSKGCIDSVTKQLNVSDNPALTLAFRDTLICNKDSVQLSGTSPGTYTWTPDINIINGNTNSPIVYPRQSTTYHVSLSNPACPTVSDSVEINVTDFITVNAGSDTTICTGDNILLHASSVGKKYTWSPEVYLDDPLHQQPLATLPRNINAITFSVLASLGSCTATDAITVTALPYPLVNAGSDTTICFASSALLHGSTSAPVYRWSPAYLVERSNSLETRAYPVGTQPFVLTVNNTSGCTKPISDTVMVVVLPKLTVFAGNDTSMITGQPLQLNGGTNGTIYKWSPSTGMNNPDVLDPVVLIDQSLAGAAGDYLRYTLSASQAQGCTASDDIVIRLFKTSPSIFVPSGFTPNNDGQNDILRPILAGMRQLDYFRIYNRYGQLIFETKTPGAGWDGTIMGRPQQSNSFVYDCSATDYLGKKATAKGTFVLIR